MYSAIWAYPWDFLDEGIDTALGRIADAGLEGVSVACAYHNIRALCPHNPKRAVYHGEGGVVYFKANSQDFGEGIYPVQSELVRGKDPLAEICKAAAKRALMVHAWTVVTHNTRLGTENPDCSIENAFGDRYPFGLCPANPKVRSYAIGLVKSVTRLENLSCIELESLGYMGMDHSGHHAKAGIPLDDLHRFLLSICFCPHCCSRMKGNGVDAAKAREDVVNEMRSFFTVRGGFKTEDAVESLSEVLGEQNAEGIVAARDEVVLSLLEEIYWLIQKPQTLSVMVTGAPLATGASASVTISQAREWTDRLLVQAFSNSTEVVHMSVADVAVRKGSTPVFAGLQAVAPFVNSAEDLAERAVAAADGGADGLQFYHYGLMPLGNLNWVRQAISGV